MNENALIVARAFSMEKEATGNCSGAGAKPLSAYMRSKAKKKGAIKKVAIDAANTPIDVEVTRIDKAAAAELYAALEIPAGHEKSASARLEALKAALKEALIVSGMSGASLGGVAGATGLISPDEGKSRLRTALNRALRFGLAGAGAGVGAGATSHLMGANYLKPTGIAAMMGSSLPGAMAGDRLADAFIGKESAAQDTKKKDEEKDTEPGTVYLESASDEKAKKAPKKKPEKDSENEVEYDKKAAAPMRYVGTKITELLNKLLKGRTAVGRKAQSMLAHAGGKLTRGEIDASAKGRGVLGSTMRAFGLLPEAAKPEQVASAEKLLSALGLGATGAGIAGAGYGASKLLGGGDEGKSASFREFLKRALAPMGQPATSFEPGKFGDALREPRGHDRQDRFEALSRWTLGKEAGTADILKRILALLARGGSHGAKRLERYGPVLGGVGQKETGKGLGDVVAKTLSRGVKLSRWTLNKGAAASQLRQALRRGLRWGVGGAALGAGHGAVRGRKENESRLKAILKDAIQGALPFAGIGAGQALGGKLNLGGQLDLGAPGMFSSELLGALAGGAGGVGIAGALTGAGTGKE